MKKILSFLLAICLLSVSCVETEYETPSYDLDLELGTGVTGVTLAQPETSSVEYSLIFTRDVNISYESDWLEVVKKDSKVTFTALSDNLFDTSRSVDVTFTSEYAEALTIKVTQKGIIPYEVAIEKDSMSISSVLSSVADFAITTNSPIDSLNVYTEAGWLDVDYTIDSVFLSVNEGNPTGQIREALVVVTAGTGFRYSAMSIKVTQVASKDYIFTVDKTELATRYGGDVDGAAITTDVDDLSQIGMSIEAEDESWFSVDLTLDSVKVTMLSDNLTTDPRSAKIILSAGTVTPIEITVTQRVSFDMVMLENAADSVKTIDAKRYSVASIELFTNVEDALLKDSIECTYPDAIEWLDATIVDGNLSLTTTSSNGTGSTGIGGDRTATVTITVGDFVVSVEVTQTEDTDYQGYPNTTPLAIGDITPDGKGVVYWVDENDNTCGKAFSLSQTDAILTTIDLFSDGLSILSYNGASNTANVVAYASYSEAATPAFYWCAQYGDFWYLPARYEIIDVVTAAYGAGDGPVDGLDVAMSSAITNAGGDVFLADGDQYYSSTVYSAANARMVRFKHDGNGFALGINTVNSMSAGNSRHVRAVQVLGSYAFED